MLRLSTAVINLAITAPDRPTAGRSYTFSVDAGEATVVIEARDSMTGAVRGRAVDRRTAGDTGGGLRGGLRTSFSNRADFERMFRSWAKASVEGLAELKALSPVDTAGAARK